MSGLHEDLALYKDSVTYRTAVRCPVKRLLSAVQQREGEEAEKQAREILENSAYPADSLCAVFRRNGYRIARESVKRHRSKDCPCVPR